MTLSTYLTKFMEVRNMDRGKLMEDTKLNPHCLTLVFRDNKYTMFTITRLVEIYGDEFKQFLEYRQCVVCGEMFIPMTKVSVTCKDPKCIKRNAYNGNKGTSYKFKEVDNRSIDKGWKPKKPVIGVDEFSVLAEKEHISYGERQSRIRGREVRIERRSL